MREFRNASEYETIIAALLVVGIVAEVLRRISRQCAAARERAKVRGRSDRVGALGSEPCPGLDAFTPSTSLMPSLSRTTTSHGARCHLRLPPLLPPRSQKEVEVFLVHL